jgi:hypothetical protein
LALTDEQWSEVEWAIHDLIDRATDYRLYRRYYDGDHQAVLSTDEFRNAFERVFAEFRDNLCPRVVDGKVDRLQLTGFGTDKDEETARIAADAIWQRNLLERRQGEVHLEALKMGDAWLMIWPDEVGFPVWYPHLAETIAVRWSSVTPGQVELAAKCWNARMEGVKYWRVNLYYEDRIEKYRTVGESKTAELPTGRQQWDVWSDPEDGEAWPLAHELGRVPVFPFNNNAPIGSYGKSELKDVIPLQNALNKANLDLLAASEFAALPQRWAVGITTEIDPVTKEPKKPWNPGADRILSTPNPNARFGEFQTAQLSQLLEQIGDRRLEMARVSSTPMHWLVLGSGQFPAGVALRAAEAPLIALVKDRAQAFGMAWEDAMEFSLGLTGVAETRLSAQWSDPVQVDPAEALESSVLKKELGIPDEQIWREMGYDEDQIAAFTDAKADRVAEMQASMGGVPPQVGTPAETQAINTLIQPARA